MVMQKRTKGQRIVYFISSNPRPVLTIIWLQSLMLAVVCLTSKTLPAT